MSIVEGELYREFLSKYNIHPSLAQLSWDLSRILDEDYNTDVVLLVTEGPKTAPYSMVRCHKDILRIRSKWFSQKISQKGISKVYKFVVKESVEIVKAVLAYIYSGNLLNLENLCIPLIELQKAAEKYGLALKEVLNALIKSEDLPEKTKSIRFTWSVEVDQNSYISAVCGALHDFTLHDSDKWGIEIRPLILGDETRMSEFYLTREVTNKAHKLTHIVNLSVYIMNSNSSTLLFSDEISATENGKYKIFVFSMNSAQTESLANTTITLFCELKVWARVGLIENFHLKSIDRKHINNEFLLLSEDMHQMLKDQRHTDITIERIGRTNAWRLHSYMVFGRTELPIPLIGKLADLLDFNGEIWRSFIFYMYTGQSRYLDDHIRTVYDIFKTLSVRGPEKKYKKILATNVNLGNAFGILCDCISNGSQDLVVHAAQYLASNSGFLSDPQAWISIASDGKEIEIIRSLFN